MEKKSKKERSRKPHEAPEFEQRIIDLARVTRVMAGGKRLRFRATVALGDKKGRVGFAIGKGSDVTVAVNKAVSRAQKNMITIPLTNETIPHRVESKFGAAKILLKPAPIGTGIKAGGVVRLVLELGGVPNVVGKILGSQNKINNTHALMNALQSFLPRTSRKKEIKEENKESK